MFYKINSSTIKPSYYFITFNSMNIFDFTYPPNKEKAQLHRLASRIFKGTDQPQSQVCQCCGRKIGQKEVETPCNIEPTQLSFLGPGVPLFFLFLRYAIILFAFMVVIFVGFSIVSNVISTDCQSSNSCINDVFTLLSIFNKKSNTLYLSIQSYISLGFVVVTILFFHFFRYKARQLEDQCDQITNSPSDYAIIIRRLPQNTTENDILQAIQVYKKDLIDHGTIQAQKIKVIKVILSYNLRSYNQAKEQNLTQFRQAVKQDRLSSFKPKQLIAPTQTSKIAIVVFQLQQTKQLFIYKPDICQSILKFFCAACIPLSTLTVKGQRVGVQRAPQPDQISWQNSGITMGGSICRKVFYGIIAIIILFAGGGAQYALQLLSNSVQDQTTKSLLGIASSILVTVFNSIILITLQITTKKERAQTLTQFQTALMVKTTLAQFLNAGIFVIISQIAANYQNFTLQSSNIMSQISLIMILDAFIPNTILFFLNYFQILQRVKRFLIQKDFIIASQTQLNELYTGPKIDFPSKYAYILKTIWLTGLYAPMIPIVVVMGLIGLAINYFIQKLLFSKSYALPNTVSKMAFQSGVELLEYFLIAFTLGQFIIYAYFYNYQIANIPLQWTITIFLTIALAILNSALPMEAINQKIFTLEGSAKSQLKYGQVEASFEVTYEMSNPAYKTNRKRRQIDGIHGFSSSKNRQKNQQLELTNLMMNEGILGKKDAIQPLLNDLKKKDTLEQQESDMYSLSVQSATVVEESEQQKKAMANEIKDQEKKESKNKIQSNMQSKRQLKSNFYVEKLVPLEDYQIQALKFYLKHSGTKFNNPNKLSAQEKLRRKEQAKRLKKERDSYYIQKALVNYNFIDIKNIKGKKKYNYQVPASQLSRKKQELQMKNPQNPRQSALAMNLKQASQQLTVSNVNDTYKQIMGYSSKSMSEQMVEGNNQKKNKNRLFNDPVKQKKSIYDPLHIQTNYKPFFNDVQVMKNHPDHYLNNQYVMNFLGTPFTNLLRKKKTVSHPQDKKKLSMAKQ